MNSTLTLKFNLLVTDNTTAVAAMPRKNHRKCPYKRKSIDELKHLSKQRGILLPPLCTQEDLVRMFKQQDLHHQPYLKYTVKDLTMFVETRGIESLVPKPRLKRAFISVLTEADANWTFRFLDLPPELRTMIYEFAMVAEPASNHHRSKPPALTRVSRLVRRESIPIFYKDAPLLVAYRTSPKHTRLAGHIDVSMRTLEISPYDKKLLERIGDDNIRHTTRMRFSWCDIFSDYNEVVLRFDMHMPYSSPAHVSVEIARYTFNPFDAEEMRKLQVYSQRRKEVANTALLKVLKDCEGGRPTLKALQDFGALIPAGYTDYV